MESVNVEIKFHAPRYAVWLAKALFVAAFAMVFLHLVGVETPITKLLSTANPPTTATKSREYRIVAIDCSTTFSASYQTTPAIGLQQYEEIVPGKEGLFDGTCNIDLTIPDRICELISLCIDHDYHHGFRSPYPWENRIIKHKIRD